MSDQPDFLSSVLAEAAPETATPLSDGQRLREMCNLMLLQMKRVAVIEEDLAAAKATLLQTQRSDLPELMREFGTTSLTLESGERVELKDDITISIPEEARSDAFAWMRENGYGGLIKTELTVAFGKGGIEDAVALAERLRADFEASDAPPDLSVGVGVHPATLKSWANERREAGEELPATCFNVFPFSFAKLLAAPKARKGKAK